MGVGDQVPTTAVSTERTFADPLTCGRTTGTIGARDTVTAVVIAWPSA